MNAKIRRHDKSLPLPEYKTAGAAAMDCLVREDVTIQPKEVGYASLNISVKPPEGHFVLMAARSSLHKRGLMFANSVGILDQDYCGDNDEYKAILFNFSSESITIQKGERIAQMIILPYDKVEWDEVDSLGEPDRGGIGSTGS